MDIAWTACLAPCLRSWLEGLKWQEVAPCSGPRMTRALSVIRLAPCEAGPCEDSLQLGLQTEALCAATRHGLGFSQWGGRAPWESAGGEHAKQGKACMTIPREAQASLPPQTITSPPRFKVRGHRLHPLKGMFSKLPQGEATHCRSIERTRDGGPDAGTDCKLPGNSYGLSEKGWDLVPMWLYYTILSL